MPKAKYEGIYHSIQKRIEAQDYPYQSLLPSENTLIEEYACSRNCFGLSCFLSITPTCSH